MLQFGSPQALAYDGPAYRGMDAATFSEEDWTFGAGSVRLLSGLYGVLRPTDLIQPYRLEMGSRCVCSLQLSLSLLIARIPCLASCTTCVKVVLVVRG